MHYYQQFRMFIVLTALIICCCSLVSALDIKDGDVYSDEVFGVGGASYGSSVSGGIVNISGGTTTSDVIGGLTNTGSANANKIYMSGGTVGGALLGGETRVPNGGDANDNIVTMTGGPVVDRVYGGCSAFGNANNNHVILQGGTILGEEIFGGQTPNGDAKNNTIDLYAGVIFSGKLNGGNVVMGDSENNTLNLYGWTGSLQQLFFFQNYNFYLPGTVTAGSTILKITGVFATDISNSVINVGIQGGGSTLKVNDEIILIDATANTLIANGISMGSGLGLQGISTLYEFDVYAASDQLLAKVAKADVNPDAESLSLGRASTLGALRQGGDLIADNGIQNLLATFQWQDEQASRSSSSNAYASLASACWSGPTLFAAVGGGHYSLKAGHRTSIDSISALTGLGWRNRGATGSLSLGAFFETGYGDYDSDNVYDVGRASIRSNGDSRYYGGGLLARYDWQSGFYAEVSARIGAVENEFSSNQISGSGTYASYDINSAYYGVHSAVGYKLRPTANSLLDLSVKYLWSRQASDNATIDGDQIKFQANDSHRLRAGARYSFNTNGCFAPYVGAAYEYEFDGRSRAGTSLVNYGVPSLKGSTGIGEVGMTYRKNAFSADLGIQGHVGKREAVTGSLRVAWAF